jgi:hypothetical protein
MRSSARTGWLPVTDLRSWTATWTAVINRCASVLS